MKRDQNFGELTKLQLVGLGSVYVHEIRVGNIIGRLEAHIMYRKTVKKFCKVPVGWLVAARMLWQGDHCVPGTVSVVTNGRNCKYDGKFVWCARNSERYE